MAQLDLVNGHKSRGRPRAFLWLYTSIIFVLTYGSLDEKITLKVSQFTPGSKIVKILVFFW